MACCMKLWRSNPLFDYIRRPDDSEHERIRKEIVAATSLVACLSTAIVILFQDYGLSFVGMASFLGTSALTLGYLLVTKRMPRWLVVLYVGSFFLVAMAYDLKSGAEMGARDWPLFILVLDLLLVFDMGDRVTFAFLFAALLWLVVTGIEDVSRFGLYDLPLTPLPYAEREEVFCKAGGGRCDEMPCPVSRAVGLTAFAEQTIIFVFNFYFTRGFAGKVNREKSRMREAVAFAEEVARSLANFDLAAAESDIDRAMAADDVPRPLVHALQSVLDNLKMYRPYLPQSCLPGIVADSDESSTTDASRTGREQRSAGLTVRKVALLVCNVIGSIPAVGVDTTAFQIAFQKHLSRTIAIVNERRGVIDVFLGDHIFSSFNASRPCPWYSASATKAACLTRYAARAEIAVNSAVATGRVTCGVCGCAEMKRYSMLGHLPIVCPAMERLGRQLGLSIVCDSRVRDDVWTFCSVRAVPKRVVLRKNGDEVPLQLWEIRTDLAQDPRAGPAAEEWMYQLDTERIKEWDAYNHLALLFVGGRTREALRSAAGARGPPELAALVAEIAGDGKPEEIVVQL
eukprot:gene16445-25205_t